MYSDVGYCDVDNAADKNSVVLKLLESMYATCDKRYTEATVSSKNKSNFPNAIIIVTIIITTHFLIIVYVGIS